MLILKKINNNVALAASDDGREVVVFGKGIGFHEMPYKLADESLIQRKFYNVPESLWDMVGTLPDDVLLAASDIACFASQQLGCSLDTASYSYIRFLAHLRFLVRRLCKGKCTQTENSSLFMQAARDFPEAYQCAYAINRVFEKEFRQSCSDEELLYLMMHINRLRSASQTE